MTEQARTSRRMLLAGVIILLVSSAAFVVAAVVTGENRWYGVAVAAAVAAVGPGSQVALGSLRLEFAAGWAALVIAIGQGLADVPETRTLSGVALVTLGVSAATFLRRRAQMVMAALYTAVLVVLSEWWSGDDSLAFGLGLAAGFVFMLWIQLEMQAAYRRDRRIRLRSDALISRSSVPILGFDFSAIHAELSAMHAAEEDFEAILRSDKALLDGLFARVKVTELNQAARSDLAADRVGLPVQASTGVHPWNVASTAAWLAAVARGERQWDGDLWLTKYGGGGLWYRVRHIVPGTDQLDYSQTIVTGMNITELKDMQATLSQLDTSKNEFIASITHEMRNPLAGVVGFSSELAQNLDSFSPEAVREMASLIDRQAREISYILDDLMAVAAAEMSALKVSNESFEVTQLVGDVVDTVGVDIDVVAEGPLFANADPVRVGQIIRNLLTNVDRYGGTRRRLEVRATGGKVRVSVIDDGPGLTDDRLEQVFGSFGHVGSSDVVGSMGLGLNVSRTLADLMGGDLVYERTGGETQFSLDLAMADAHDVTRSES